LTFSENGGHLTLEKIAGLEISLASVDMKRKGFQVDHRLEEGGLAVGNVLGIPMALQPIEIKEEIRS